MKYRKPLIGCGGCGCLTAMMLTFGGVSFALYAMANASHIHEAIIPSWIVAVLGVVLGLFALVIVGIAFTSKGK